MVEVQEDAAELRASRTLDKLEGRELLSEICTAHFHRKSCTKARPEKLASRTCANKLAPVQVVRTACIGTAEKLEHINLSRDAQRNLHRELGRRKVCEILRELA